MKKKYSISNQSGGLNNLLSNSLKRITIKLLLIVSVILILTSGQKVKSQTYGAPLFTEDFGAVPTGYSTQTAIDNFRGYITGRGSIGSAYWYWPYSCPTSGKGYMNEQEVYSGLIANIPAAGSDTNYTAWTFVPVSSPSSGSPYNGSYKNNPNYLWCLNGNNWTVSPNNCSGTLVRWYQIASKWEIGYWEREHIKVAVPCSQWHNTMDDGGYALATNPNNVHGLDGGWISGHDHTGNKDSHGNLNGMMLVVNAAWVKGLFYKRHVTGLCYGAQFAFNSYYADILSSNSCSGNGLPVNIRYEIWDKDPGNDEADTSVAVGSNGPNGAKLLALTNTGNITATSSTTLKWNLSSLLFNVPQNQDSVVLILRNNSIGGCGNDLAIDDITLSPYIPFTIGYNAVTANYCSTGTITLKGSITSGSIPSSIPYVFQWQVADKGNTNWQNIGSLINNFSNASIVLNVGDLGNKIYRIISAASAENFNNSNCYVASASFNGNSVVIPTGSITATSDICGTSSHAAESVSFTVNYQGNVFPWTYYYTINGGAVQSQVVNSPNVTDTKTIQITDNTTIELTKISINGCTVLINSQKLIAYSTSAPAAPLQISGPNPACIGSTATFSVQSVPGAISYNWLVSGDWQILSGQGTNTVQLLIGSTPITTSIQTSNACGNNTFTSNVFQTNNLPPTAPNSITTPNGFCFSSTTGSTDILFTASNVNGAQNYIWSWDSRLALSVNQQNGTGQYLQSIVLSVPNNISGFNVNVETQNDCGNSAQTSVRFIPSPILASASAVTSLCNNATTTLTVTASGGTGALQYSLNGGTFQNGNTFNVNAAGSPYTVTVKDANNCTANTNSVLIAQLPATNITVNANTSSICSGQTTAILTADSNGNSYLWNTGASEKSITISDGALYSVTIVDGNGCKGIGSGSVIVNMPPSVTVISNTPSICSGQGTAILTAEPAGAIYLWDSGETTQSINVSDGTLHFVTVTEASGCFGVNSGSVIVNTIPTVSGPDGGEVCAGSEFVFALNTTGNNLAYSWFLNTINNGIISTSQIQGPNQSSYSIIAAITDDNSSYFSVITNECGSTTSSIATLKVDNKPTVTNPQSLTISSGATANFSVTATGTGNINYQWYKDNSLIPAATNSQFSILNSQFSDVGAYSCAVSNLCSTVTSGNAILTVNPPVTLPVITGQPQSVNQCACSSTFVLANPKLPVSCNKVDFSVKATGTGLKYQWQENGQNIKDGVIFSGATSSNLIVSGINTRNGNTYRVIVTNKAGVITSNTATLTVSTAPVITGKPQSVCANDGGSSSFSITATGANLTYQWLINGKSIQDGSIYSGSNSATLTISNVTGLNNKQFSCSVCNSCSCVASAIAVLTVKPSCSTPLNERNYEITSGSAKLLWSSVSGVKVYQVAYWTTDETNPTIVTTATPLIILTHLQANTQYCWKVRTLCITCACNCITYNTNDCGSAWSSPTCFTTLASANKRLLSNGNGSEANFDVKVYPNPTSGLVNITLPNLSNASELSIFNLNGQKVFGEVISNTDNNTIKQIDLSGYKQGVYMVTLKNDQIVKTVKLIVQ